METSLPRNVGLAAAFALLALAAPASHADGTESERSPPLCSPAATPPATESAARAARPSVRVIAAGRTIEVTATEKPGDLRITIDGAAARSFAFALPPGEAGAVTEVRACPWSESPGLSGLAVAVEALSTTATARRSYYWITASFEDDAAAKPLSPNVGHILFDSPEDFDLGAIVNSGGDSIYVLLARHRRFAGLERIEGFAFVNNCPIGGDFWLKTPDVDGTLLPLAAVAPK